MMRFACLGSGSRGNAFLVQAGGTTVLIDCGFSLRELTRRLARFNLSPDALAGVLVTHEHGDHIRGLGVLTRRHPLPVWMSPGTRQAQREIPETDIRALTPGVTLALGDIEVAPFSVPHDAREPCQLVLGDGARRLGVLTDAGHVTDDMISALGACDALAIECNHDPDRLAGGPYPLAVQQRIAGEHGHLSNAQAADALHRLDRTRLRHVAAAHLSAENNTLALARGALAEPLGCAPGEVEIADQEAGLGWRDL